MHISVFKGLIIREKLPCRRFKLTFIADPIPIAVLGDLVPGRFLRHCGELPDPPRGMGNPRPDLPYGQDVRPSLGQAHHAGGAADQQAVW